MLRRGEDRVRTMREEVFPAPTRGWQQAGNLVSASPEAAEVLDNFFVTAQGARLRGGKIRHARVGSPVVRLFTYTSGGAEILFATTETAIHNVSTAHVGFFSSAFSGAFRKAAAPVVSSLTSGDWSTTQITTSAGQFLVLVNGADTGRTFNGSTFSNMSITGVSSSALSHVNSHKRRLWFVEEGTTSAWYLAVDSIGGTATEFDFGAVFSEGGSLLFTATWSLDSGNGLDDVFLAVSSQGEIAVYEGTDPTSASTWGLKGVYRIGKPLNKHATFKAGGDLAILTEDGIVPVSEALMKDRAALQANAISAPIEDAWKQAIANRTTEYPITATLWQSQSLLIIGTPSKDSGRNVGFAAYAATGAWSRIVGWDIRCSAVFGDALYFGSQDGNVYRGDVGGNDDGSEYIGVYVPKFSYSQVKRGAISANLTYRAQQVIHFDMYAHADYQVDEMGAVTPAMTNPTSTWGSGVWGTFAWGGNDKLNSYTEWQKVRASGYALAPAVKVASNQPSLIEFEIVAMRLRSEQGYPR